MIVSAVRRSTVAAALLALLFWAADAIAATVMLVQPASPSQPMAEAIVRVRGELISEGFNVEVMDAAPGELSRRWLEELAEARQADAVVAVLGDEPLDSVEVWIIDKVTEKTVVRRIPFKPQSDQEPKTFAIHTLELLRASFLEIDLRPDNRPKEAKSIPQAVAHFVEGERPPARVPRFAVEVGATALVGLGDVGPSILPVMRLGVAVSPSFVAQVELAGRGSHPTVQNNLGTARLTQEFALLGARYRFLPGRRLRPCLSLSAGALHTRAEGRADSPQYGRNAELWSFLLDGGLGVGLTLAGRLELGFAAHAQLAEPYPAVRFDRSVVATSARPSLLFTLTVGAWL